MAIRGPSRGPTYKVVLLGELGVGKTSLFRRLKDNTFDEYQTATTGIDSCTKVIKIGGDNVMVSDEERLHRSVENNCIKVESRLVEGEREWVSVLKGVAFTRDIPLTPVLSGETCTTHVCSPAQ